MEGDYLPAGYLDDDQLSDYNSDDGIEWLNPALAFHFAIDDDDDFVIDEWVEQAQEEGWLGSDSDDDSDIVYTDGLPVKKIFVTNFQSECIPNDLRTLFSKFGAVTDVSILEGKSSRYAFVTFGNPEHACLALKATPNELQLRWKRLRVFPAHSWHQPKEPPGEQWTRDESEVEGECFIHKLNDDCLLYIFKFLEIKEQMKMERVCKRWQDLSQSMWLRRSDFDLSCLSDKSSHFSVPAFRKVLRFCGEHLTKLDFCTVKSDSLSAVLPLVTHNCPNLEVLKLSEVSVNRCALHSLSSKCRNLRCLTLRGCQGIKDYELGRLVSRLDKLEHLDVSKNTVIQGYFLRSIKPNLVSLVLDECNNLGLKHLLSELSKPHWNVRMLSLNSCQTLTSLDVQTLCTSAAPKLKQLRLNEYFPRLNTGSLRALGSLSELTHLSVKFNSCVKKDVILKICDGCLKLEELDISGCVDRDQKLRNVDPAIEAVARLKHLERLKLNYVMIYDVALENLAKHCKGLRLLECKGCPNITHIGVASVLARCTRLETLDLSGCYITNEVVTDATLAVGARKEKIKLTLYLGGTQVVKTDVDDLNQPLLKIILEDRSIRHLRPDYSDDVYFEHYYEGDSDYDVYDSDMNRGAIQGYRFEPCFTEEELAEIEDGEDEVEPDLGRANNTDWCACNTCKPMPDDKQSVCCNDNANIASKKGDANCITVHGAFQQFVLHEDALNLLRHNLLIYEKKAHNIGQLRSVANKSWRYLAYRQFWNWVNSWKKMGKNVRFPIPSCVVNCIREKWPDENNQYVGFLEAEENLPG